MTPSITRLQAYLRNSAAERYNTVSIPPFTLFFHPTDRFPYFNYAIPDEPVTVDVQSQFHALRQEYTRRGCQPRFEFIDEYSPDLAAALRAAGFVEEGRQHFMICTPLSFKTPAALQGITISVVPADAPLADVQAYITVQRQGFDPTNTTPVTEEEAQGHRATLETGTAFLARLDNVPVSAGMLMNPLDGITELAGVATLVAYRRRGIASALTAYALQTAFAQGVELACLTAGDAAAGRVYEQAGFFSFATMLAYHVPAEGSSIAIETDS
jgi:ribosomal protein S18 acetylase RimI-like enzyme